MSADFTGDKPSALDTLAEDLGRAVLAAAAKSGDPLTGAALGPNQLRVLVERTCEVKEQLEDYLRYLQGALTVATAPRPEEQRAPAVASPRQGHDGDMDVEVIKLSIPVPKLHVSHDMKQKNAERSTADATRAYLRDVRKYLQLVRGGDRDAVRCLFVGNTLEGMAKTWYDQWTTARENFTFDELTAALLARFAPEVQPRDVEARNALASGLYHMRSNETVPSYQSRFEALVTPIADLSEGDRIFWFQRGLSE
ncbi:hypothetical protein Vafri_19356, partial [Volvox africanus]